MPIPFAAIVALAGGIGITAARWQNEQINQAWSTAGAELGLRVDRAELLSRPAMSGHIGDVVVTVSISGGSKNKATNYVVRHRAVGPPMALRRQGVLSFLHQVTGRRDVVLGDPFFDDRVIVDTPHAGIHSFMTPARRAAVLELFETWYNARCTHESVEVRTGGVETDAATITKTIRKMADIAQVLGAPEPVDHALENRLQGNLAVSVDELHDLNEHQPNTFTQTLEAEALVGLGDHRGGADLFGQVDQSLGSTPPQPDGWRDLAASPSPSPHPASTPDLPLPPQLPLPLDPAGARSRSLAQQPVIADLFDPSRPTYELIAYFEKTYQFAKVSWSGEVTAVQSYRHDRDFGAGPGVKATVLLGSVGRSALIANEIHAIVQLAPDAPVSIGATLSFTGSLARVDRYARKIYVEAAD